jgi:multiple sugar transport system substrate-binding protein
MPPRPRLRWLLLLALLVAACRSRSPETLEFWGLGREGEVVRGMVAGFERENPGLRVRVQQVPWSAAHEKLLTAYVGEAMPDVFQVGNTWIPEFVALGAVEALDERLAASRVVARDDYFPGIADASSVDGRLYGLPWYVDTRLLFYRQDLLAAAGIREPPRTWVEWREAMERVKARGGEGDFGVLLPITEWQPVVILALQRGAELLRENDTRGNFRSVEFREAFAFYVDLFRRGLAPLAGQTQIANLYQDFARGVFAFYLTGPWNVGEFRARLPEDVEWATTPCPGFGDDFPGVSVAGGSSLAIFRGSSQREEAWKLLEYLSAPERQLELYRATGDLPAVKRAWAGGPDGDAETRAFRTQLERVRATPQIPEWERIATLVTRYAEAAIRGRMEIDAALAGLDRDVDELLEKRRWMLERERDGGAG